MGGKGSGVSRKRTTLPRHYRPGWMRRCDARTAIPRRVNERMASIASDLGGVSEISTIAGSLLERYVHCEALIEQFEETARAGKAIDTTAYLAVVDRLVRIGQALGLDRIAKPTPRALDYIAEQSAGTAP